MYVTEEIHHRIFEHVCTLVKFCHTNELNLNDLKKSLRRGDNIVEGHFVERSWAGLLTNPLKDYQMTALEKAANITLVGDEPTLGALMALDWSPPKYSQKRRSQVKNQLVSPKTQNDVKTKASEYDASIKDVGNDTTKQYICVDCEIDNNCGDLWKGGPT